MTNFNKVVNSARSAAVQTMSAAQFNKTAGKTAKAVQNQCPEKLTGAMNSIAAQNKANILQKMKLIQMLRKQGISTTGVDSKTLDKILTESKKISQTWEAPTQIPEVVAAKKILKASGVLPEFEPRFEPRGIGGKITNTSPSLPGIQ